MTVLKAPTASLNKNRGLLIAVSLFSIFNTLVFALNFYTSSTLDDGAVSINLSGRQRMLRSVQPKFYSICNWMEPKVNMTSTTRLS
ncbi:MAG: hypothetical protein H7Z18_11985 [Methylophilaceae bacterium]|nr:hypothetical protein [Methylophilaceae bacterium]